jgi:hypothetical protein
MDGVTIHEGDLVTFTAKDGEQLQGPVVGHNAAGKVWISHPRGGTVLRPRDFIKVVK